MVNPHDNDDDRIPWGIIAFFGVVFLLGLSILVARCAHAEPVNLTCAPEAFLVPPPPPGPEPRTGVDVWCFWDEDEADPNADPNSYGYFIDRAPASDPNAWQSRYRDTNPKYSERQFLDVWVSPLSTYLYRVSYGTPASASNTASATTPASVPVPTSTTTTTTASTTSTTASTTSTTIPPATPQNLRYAVITCTEIRLDWDPVAAATGYRVYKWGSSQWTLFASTVEASLGVPNLTPGATYYWEVAAVDPAGNASPPSPWVTVSMPSCETTTTTSSSTTSTTTTSTTSSTTETTVTTTSTSSTTATTLDVVPPPVPPNLAFLITSCSTVTLTWGAVVDVGMGLADYRVFQWRNGAWTYFATVTDPTFNATGLVAGATYYWCVAAVDGAGNQSPLSSWVATVMPSCATTTTATVSTTTTLVSTTTSLVSTTTTFVSTTTTIVSTTITTTTTRPSTTTTTRPGCLPPGASCSTGTQCCSGSCGGAWWKRTCR